MKASVTHKVRVEGVDLGETLLSREDGNKALVPEKLADVPAERRVLDKVLDKDRLGGCSWVKRNQSGRMGVRRSFTHWKGRPVRP